jgi:hypothetical protein
VPSSTSTLCGCEQTRNPLFIAARLLHLNTSPSPSDRVQAHGPHISKKQDDTIISRQDGLIAIPRGGREALAGEWPDVSDFVSAFPKLLIYSLDSAPREAEEVYRAARKFDIEERRTCMSESDWDEISYLKPANQDFAAPTLQHILNHHLHIVKQMRAHAERTQHPGDFDWDMWKIGRESKTTTQKCEAEKLVATLEELARGG